ncbi:MAG: SUMF1/EgtB/PvdO family nonheme iron enzyme [Akkermansiaceae bacterium]|jgi:formylglycine-generating enzyme required for sulfatase activity
MGQTRQSGDIVGDYRLLEAVSGGVLTRTWKAEQISVRRDVMLEMLKRESAADIVLKTNFLSDVRAKAAVSHAVIGAVYEAHGDEDATYYARERLLGKSLDQLIEEGNEFAPLEVVFLLEQLADAQLHLESQDLAAVSIAAHHVIVDGPALRMMNLVSDGPRSEAQSTAGKQLLGALFDEMLLPAQPGSTRVGSLLAYMIDLDRPVPLTWKQIKKLSRQVIDQLEGNDQPSASQSVGEDTEPVNGSPGWGWALVSGLIFGAGLIFYFVVVQPGDDSSVEEVEAQLPPVKIAPSLSLSAHEVTIGQYRAFLESISKLDAADRAGFDHPDQPKDKESHHPDDWFSLSGAAKEGNAWSDRLVSDGCPIVGVDWWDAYAFSRWQGGRLPTLAEWKSASEPTEAISGWGKASAPEMDRTESGLIGMAGNVREWTRDDEVNPAFQLRSKKPVACGGSFLTPGTGVASRVWLDSRSHRADDLGFRIIFEK